MPSVQNEPKVFSPEPAFEDERGVIVNVLEHQQFEHLAFITSTEGSVRGNHFHANEDQWLFIVSGRMAVRAIDIITEEKWNYMVEEGQLEYMPPGIAHAYYFPMDTVMLNITPKGRRDADNEERTEATTPWEVWHGPGSGTMQDM